MRARRARVWPILICSVVVALAATACFPNTRTQRIDTPPDTSVKFTAEPPEFGVFAGGGTFVLRNVQIGAARCDVDESSSIFDLFRDPLDTDDSLSQVPLDDSGRETVRATLESLDLRMAATGSTAVLATSADAARFLPFSGTTTGGLVQRVDASSVPMTLADRSGTLQVDVEGEQPAGVSEAAAAVAFEWVEKPRTGRWVLDFAGGDASCNADAAAQVVRVGPAPVLPGPPTGASTVKDVSAPVGSAVDLINSSTWVTGEGSVSLMLPNEQALARGQLIESGAGWLVVMDSSHPDASFAFRGAKTSDGEVRGTLFAGGGIAFAVLSG